MKSWLIILLLSLGALAQSGPTVEVALPINLTGGQTVYGTIRLSSPAPAGGIEVELVGDALLEVPREVVVPPNQTSARFPARVLSNVAEEPITQSLTMSAPGGQTRVISVQIAGKPSAAQPAPQAQTGSSTGNTNPAGNTGAYRPPTASINASDPGAYYNDPNAWGGCAVCKQIWGPSALWSVSATNPQAYYDQERQRQIHCRQCHQASCGVSTHHK